MQAMILTGDTYAQLLDDVRAILRNELQHTSSVPSATPNPLNDALLTVREAAELLDVTVQTMHDWKRRGLLKYHKMGSRTYFKRADVLAALQSQQRTKK